MYDRILLPTDGSEWAISAARHAFALARLGDGTVHVLSVVDLRHFEDELVGPDREEGMSVAEQSAHAAVDHVRKLAEEADCRVQTSVRQGIPHTAIIDYVAAHDVDLVVMGTHGRTGLQRFFLGSVAERVLREAPVPVATVHLDDERTVPSYDHVLVPTDGSEGATTALTHALDVVTATGGRLHVLSIVDSRAIAGGFESGPALPSIRTTLETYARDSVDAFTERATEAGVESTGTVRVGLPADEICQYVDEAGVDLVVMGTHGRTGLERVVFGSVTERVVRTTGVPVLTVRPSA
ncbi:Nucleotide-binding universal stress protein, UspA family [Halogranum amylolyticum]|uniref:Nucleotide-binding universal stress protein, UspA family n=1 Tax=Halogranum amylolyticum TaxID=660520 RepID=A0A1H8N0Y4_9EURY|nr:universal stress protein [Halogranum amylolyticum]SEO23301.1 Nucleotide-binding universal stress protein, UspA family [Halogranum amylolyticum]